MANFSPGPERNPLEIKVVISWRRPQFGLKFSLALFQKPGWDFQPGKRVEKSQKVYVIETEFQPGLKIREDAQWGEVFSRKRDGFYFSQG